MVLCCHSSDDCEHLGGLLALCCHSSDDCEHLGGLKHEEQTRPKTVHEHNDKMAVSLKRI